MEKQTSDKQAQIKNGENSKQAKIKKIIDRGFAEDKTYSIFHKNNPHNLTELNAPLHKLVSENQSTIEHTKDVELLSEITFFSLNRIFQPTHHSDSDNLFCCLAISPPKKKQYAVLVSCPTKSASLRELKLVRHIKRANCESCPMRLQFKFDTYGSKYQISEDDSNLYHNHSAVSNSSEVILGIIYQSE